MVTRAAEEVVIVPRSAVRFPLELPVPEGFSVEVEESWPLVEGALEFVEGKLYYMPPSADRQQDTCADILTVLGLWRREHAEFVLAGNEAGMLLHGDARGADAAVWRRADLGGYQGKFRRVPPVLAVEAQGELEDAVSMEEKVSWYLARGVTVVWLLFPRTSDVVVVTKDGRASYGPGERVPAHDALPALEPMVDELFAQVRGSTG